MRADAPDAPGAERTMLAALSDAATSVSLMPAGILLITTPSCCRLSTRTLCALHQRSLASLARSAIAKSA